MSKYTTGELARLCNVTVRTVQYYDTRGILVPDELSEGGRRLYSEENLKKLHVICFLRSLDLPIDSIAQLLEEEHPEHVISLLIEQKEQLLKEEADRLDEKLRKLSDLKKELRITVNFSINSLGDIAIIMENKKKLSKVHRNMILWGLPVTALEVVSIIYWILSGNCIPFLVYLLVAVPFGYFISRYYFKRVAYICPECHEVFRPSIKEAFFANHTPNTRKLTCTCCGHKGFCVETYHVEE